MEIPAAIAVIMGLLAAWLMLLWLTRPKTPRSRGNAVGHDARGRPQRPSATVMTGTRLGGVDASRRPRTTSHSIVVSALVVIAIGSVLADIAEQRASEAGSREPVQPLTDASAAAANQERSVAPHETPAQNAGEAPPAPPATVIAVGDLTECPKQDLSVPKLVASLPGAILAAGDIVDPDGSDANYRTCYEPLWGSLKARIWPVPGNHDYVTEGAEPYFSYFGVRAGEPQRGYYAFDQGSWRIIALNSMCGPVGGCHARSAQGRWLAAELAAHPSDCILAFWHHPLHSSGNGHDDKVVAFWRMLHEAGADVVVNGHDHHYERFAPMTPAGTVDSETGIRQFTVGTGGGSLTPPAVVAPNSEALSNASHGVLKLTLNPGSYEWEFVPTEDDGFRDSGRGTCSRSSAPSETDG